MARANGLRTFAIVAAWAGVFGAVQAAAPVAPLLTTNPILFSDNSADFLINVDGSVDGNGAPTVTVGDILFTITGINTIESGGTSTTIGAGTTFNELTTLTAVRISQVNPIGPPISPNDQGIVLSQFIAAPLSPADATYFNWATGQVNTDGVGPAEFTFSTCFGATDNNLTFGCMFESDPNYTRDSTVQAGLTSATDGTARLFFTLDPANGDHLNVVAPPDTASFGLIPPATAVHSTSINIDATIAAQNFAPVVFGTNITGGNGGFSSPTVGSGYPIFDNLDLTTSIVVPEPGSLALISLGLLVLGARARRRNGSV